MVKEEEANKKFDWSYFGRAEMGRLGCDPFRKEASKHIVANEVCTLHFWFLSWATEVLQRVPSA